MTDQFTQLKSIANGIGLKLTTLTKHNFCSIAAFCGNYELLQWGIEQKFHMIEETCALAALGNHWECLRLLHENKCPWDQTTCINAAKKGHFESLFYAVANECPISEQVYINALMFGYKKCFEFAIQHSTDHPLKCQRIIALNGDLTQIKTFFHHGCMKTDDLTTMIFILENHLNCLQWICETQTIQWPDEILEFAIMCEQFECLQYISTFVKPTKYTLECAIQQNNVHYVIFLLEQNCPFDETLLNQCHDTECFIILCLECLFIQNISVEKISNQLSRVELNQTIIHFMLKFNKNSKDWIFWFAIQYKFTGLLDWIQTHYFLWDECAIPNETISNKLTSLTTSRENQHEAYDFTNAMKKPHTNSVDRFGSFKKKCLDVFVYFCENDIEKATKKFGSHQENNDPCLCPICCKKFVMRHHWNCRMTQCDICACYQKYK